MQRRDLRVLDMSAPKHDISGPYPFTDLTRQWTGYDRITYPDGTTSVAYYRTEDGTERQAFLVFSAQGWRHGFLWVKDTTQGGAITRYRNGARADHHARRLMNR